MSPTCKKTRVAKVGGSLFLDSELPRRLRRWIENDSGHRIVLLAGGGILVDCVRQFQIACALSDEDCHSMSVRLMSETAILLHELLPELPIIYSSEEMPIDQNVILDCRSHMENTSVLEHSWNTTSDSIAAEIACTVKADELWLLKSVSPTSSRRTSWQNEGIVDGNFCQSAESLKSVFIANLASDDLLSIQGN